MTEDVEKRRSKWDLPSEINCPTKSRETMQPESGGDPRQCSLQLGSSSKHAGYPSESGPRPKSSSKDNPEMPLYQIEMEIDKKDGLSREPMSVSRNDLKDCVVDRSGNSKYSDIEVGGRNRVSREVSSSSHSRRMDNGGPDPAISQSYKTNFSPGHDSWRRRSRSKSPRNGRSRPRRGQSRSRSRSPYHGIRREAEGWKERGRFGPRGSPPLCRDFAVGKCRMGSQCRYPHEDGGRIRRQYERNYHDTDVVDTRENRHESGRYTQHGSEEHFSDSVERRDHSKLPYRHDNFHKEDREDRDFQRNGKSTERCLNFTRGKCQKGATCRYIHHEVSRGGEYFAKSGSRERDYDRGDRDVPPRHEQRRDLLRSSDTPCKFFLEGRCRNGGNCKFSHLGGVPSLSHGRHEDDRRWRNWPNESWSTRDGSTHPQHSQSENHVDVKYENLSGNIHGEVPSHSHVRLDDDMRELNWHSENWLTRDPSTHTRHSQSEDPVVDANFKILSGDIHGIVSATHIQNTPNEPAKQPDLQGSFLSSQQDPVMEGGMVPRQEEKLSVSSESQKDVNFFEMQKPSLALLPEQSCSQFDKSQYAPQAPSLQTINTLELPQHIAPPTSFNDPSQQQAFYPLISNLECQSATSLHSSNVQNANFGVQNQQFPLSTEESQKNHYIMPSNVQVPYAEKQCGVVLNLNANNQTPQVPYPTNSHMTEVGTVESTAKQDVLETKAPNSLSSSLINNKVVTSEQMTQLTNLSASLAQIFGNSQQLPELYAALNPSNATRISLSQSTPKIVPTAASTPLIQQPPSVNPTSSVPIAQMGGSSWSAQPYDPMTDSMEPNKVATSNLSLGYLLKADQQKDALIPHTISTQTPYLDKDEPKNVGGINRIDNLDGNKEKANHEQVDMPGSKSDRVNGVPKNVQNETNDHDTKAEKVSADGKADEENKKNKDVKVIKIFKNALVEFVKELLKPTWKEGNMSKEAHKTVVKKVVDKVTGTLQTNIPSTQEKIDQYLSHSKPKLSKLVQAYVEKFSKT